MRPIRTAAAAMLLFASLTYAQNASAPAAFITGVGNFSHIVTDLEKSLVFYRDVIGLQPNVAAGQFSGNPAIMDLGNTPGAQSRFTSLRVPGSAIGVELIDYKDIQRTPARPRFQDPGAANLIVRVRDLDSVMARVKSSGTKILTLAGGPTTIGSGAKVVFIQDPDGFIVELSQPANPAPPTADNPSNILGGGFELTVEDSARTVDFYQKVLGFTLTLGTTFNNDKVMTDTAGTPGAAFKQSRGPIPGTNATITFIEFKDIDRKPLRTRVQDPGTPILQLNVRDMDGLMKVLKANGAEIVSKGGVPVSLGAGKLVIVRDPNNLFLEFIQR